MGSLNAEFPRRFTLNAETRKEIPKEIRAALEEHGCFVLKCDEGNYFSQEMMVELENFFRVDDEAKAEIAKLTKYKYHKPNELLRYYEAVTMLTGRAIDKEAESFTRLTWPDGNDKFCQTLSSTGKGLLELSGVIMDIVVAGYGLDESMSTFANAACTMRMSKYMPPEKGEKMGLPDHVDGTYISILTQNEVDGLKIKSKEGNWFDVNLEEGSFLVFAGEMLQAWSNGRLVPAVHKVEISGEKDRYSVGFFLAPQEEEVVQAPAQLVDGQNPARYRPFVFKDFHEHGLVNRFVEGTLKIFAGI